MNWVVECENVSKQYGGVTAIKKLSLKLEKHKIYGLLGRNGAGKTTLLHMLTGQIVPTDGDIRLQGEAPFEKYRVLKQTCFIKESQNYIKTFKVKQIMDLASAFFPQWDPNYAKALLEDFKLDPRKKVKSLSRGMLSTVGVIIGLASRAEITIFDEPYLGLDAVARNMFYDRLLEDYGDHPRTILLSTHLIDEVSKLFEEVIIMKEGSIVLRAETDSLRDRAYNLYGKPEALQKHTDKLEVLHSDQFGKKSMAAVFGSLSKEHKALMQHDGIEIAALPLQKLMIYLTSEQRKGAAVNESL